MYGSKCNIFVAAQVQKRPSCILSVYTLQWVRLSVLLAMVLGHAHNSIQVSSVFCNLLLGTPQHCDTATQVVLCHSRGAGTPQQIWALLCWGSGKI